MAEAISIPSQFEFKELLSHTFPGFFSALSIFMLIDYFSAYDLTAWAIGTFNGLIAFVGLILVVGTILGVIFDGIHHSFIENDIFDKFEYIYSIKSTLNMRLKDKCALHGDKLSRCYYFKNIGDKGDKAISIDEHLDKGYYRYSEFYSNIFISLLLFSIIAPLYIFQVLQVPWRASILVGISSLIAACICLICSYASYKRYLRALFSVICSYTGIDVGNCYLCSKDTNDKKNIHSIIRFLFMVAFFYIPIRIAEIFYVNILDVHYIKLIILLIIILILENQFIFKNLYKTKLIESIEFKNEHYERIKRKLSSFGDSNMELSDLDTLNFENNYLKSRCTLERLKNIFKDFDLKRRIGLNCEEISRSASGSLVTFLSSLFACMIIMTIYFMPYNTNVEPANITFIENITSDQSIIEPTGTIIFQNTGTPLINAKLKVNGYNASWIKVLEDDNVIKDENSNSSYTIKRVPTMGKIFLMVRLNSKDIIKSNASAGSYTYTIDFDYIKHKRWILNENSMDFPEKEIPIYINLTKSH